jgi:co-chaperonin GroES (HSP10)
MRVEASAGRVVCVPHQLEEQNNSLIVTNKKNDNIAKVVDSRTIGTQPNDIIVYDKEKAHEFTMDGQTYIVFSCDGVLAHIREEEEVDNG